MIRSALARRLLPRLVAGTLAPSWLARVVHGWVRADATLNAEYDALRRIELEQQQVSLTGDQLALIERFVLAGVDGPQEAKRARRAWPALSGAVVAACIAVFFVIRTPGGSVGVVGDLAARGRAMATSPLGLKVSCVDGEQRRVLDEATAGARQSGGRLSCPRGDLLAFSTTNLGKETRHFFVLGVSADGSRHLFSPFEGMALPVSSGTVDAPLSRVNETASLLDEEMALFVFISDEPFSARSVEQQLDDAERQGIPLSRIDRLPVDVPVQARIDVRLRGRDVVHVP